MQKIPIEYEDDKSKNSVPPTAPEEPEKQKKTAESNGATKPENAGNEGLEKLNKEYLEHLQRLQAEFENYKKRVNKEKSDTIRYATSQISEKLLSVVDNLKRGQKLSATAANVETVLEGMRMVEKQLLDILGEHGVKAFESLGEKFDPDRHEPVYAMETADHEVDKIIEEIEQGYMIHDKLLRAAKVVVAKEPAAPEKNESENG